MMKRRLFILSILTICVVSIAAGTLAYFSTTDRATNVITAGNVKIDLEEWSKTEDGTLVPFEDVDDVMPGTEVSKIVQVKNIGGQSAWVRISVKKAITLAEGMTGEIDLPLVTYDIDTEHWTEKDGYYYYNEALAPEATTEPLFTTVSFSERMDNRYQHSKVVITVLAQATQTAHNGTSAMDAAGWDTAAEDGGETGTAAETADPAESTAEVTGKADTGADTSSEIPGME